MDGPLPNFPTLHGLRRPSEVLNQINHAQLCGLCLQPKYFKRTIALRILELRVLTVKDCSKITGYDV